MDRQSPYDSYRLVGKRDCCDVGVSTNGQLDQPTVRIVPLGRSVDDRPGPVYEQCSKVRIARLTHAKQLCFTAGGMLSWHKSQPRCKLSSVFEILCIADRRRQGAGRDRTDSGHLF